MTRTPVTVLVVGVGLSNVALGATHRADHLIITEVGVNTARDNSPPTSEYIEIHNPTNAPIVLNDGVGAYYLTDDAASGNEYWRVVRGLPLPVGSDDYLFKFPVGTTIPAHGTVVVTYDSGNFLDEFFGNNDGTFTETPARFLGLPGSPQLFEYTQDGAGDGVADVTKMDTGAAARMSITNGSEFVTLFYWDGTSDLVADVDVIAWGGTNPPPRKTTATVIDGIDPDTATSAYKDDAVIVGATVQDVMQRRSLVEKNEADLGNGLTGHDELSESYSVAAGDPWGSGAIATATPGVPLFSLDSFSIDALSWLTPVAVSRADGPGGTASPLDYGADGTLTELYVTSLDTDRDGSNEAIYLAVRGDLFGEPDTNEANVELVLVDANPHASTGGVRRIVGPGNDLNDTNRPIDAALTGADVSMDPSWPSTASWDSAVVFDKLTDSAANQDVLTWLVAAGGSTSNFVSVPTTARPKFDGSVNAALFPAAAGTSHAGADLFEAAFPVGAPAVTHLGLTAVTVVGNGANASPNTLPEGPYDSLVTATVPIERFVCWDVAASKALVWHDDADGDGHGAAAISTYCGPSKAGVVASGDDCDDGDTAVFTGKAESCDGKDNDCDGLTDDSDPDALTTKYFADTDMDTFGDAASSVNKCAAPFGYVTNDSDCDDKSSLIKPGATEFCNAADDDCDTLVDDADPGVTGQNTYFSDVDKDTFGDPATGAKACFQPAGRVSNDSDCDDAKATVTPIATEQCNGFDDDCDALVDDADTGVSGQSDWYADVDTDTFGDPVVITKACVQPVGTVSNKLDCNDAAAAIRPTASEVCDAVDNDCDTLVDDDDPNVSGRPSFYEDDDNDSYGNPSTTTDACEAPSGFVSDDTDCDDAKAAVNPGAAETCNTIDDDCDAQVDDADSGVTGQPDWYKDVDADTFGDPATGTKACVPPGATVSNKLDCDDTKDAIKPGATEVCDVVDNDCDALIDDLDPGVTGQGTYYVDLDDDTYGDPDSAQKACSQPADTVTDGTDCGDDDPDVNIDAEEVCNEIDDDCDGGVDDLDPEGAFGTFWYADADDDGHGDESDPGVEQCDPPADASDVADDCDDTRDTVYPDAAEVCDTFDNDCDDLLDLADTDVTGTTTYYVDADGDSYGDVQDPGTAACADPGPGHSLGHTDCDDASNATYPGAPELLDGKDNDCDGEPETVDTDTDTGVDTDTSMDTDTSVDTDTADTDTDADTDSDTDSDTDADTDSDTDADADSDTDTGLDTDTGQIDDKKCGCATGGGGPGWLLGALVLAALGRRRAR